jgi:microcystin-dependent protein
VTLNLGSALKYGFQKVLGTTTAPDIDAGFGAMVDQTIAALDALIPPGFLGATAAATAPTGWLLCDGAAVSRATYAALFTAVGTAYGAGNGTTTLTVALTTGQLAAHAHVLRQQTAIGGGIPVGVSGATGRVATGGADPIVGGPGTDLQTENAGSGTAHNNMPPYLIGNIIIRHGN